MLATQQQKTKKQKKYFIQFILRHYTHTLILVLVLFCLGCHNKNQTGWLKQQYLSRFEGWKVQDEGANGFSS